MKKKLLSLVLAGAMVASTSVSAFASTPAPTVRENTTISPGDEEKNIDIGITGDILDDKGNTKPGTISVTVPTAVNFTVTKGGVLTSGDMVITNNTNEKIKVSVKKFTDANADKNINIVKKSEFESGSSDNSRDKIWLSLVGTGVSVGFESAERGKMYNLDNDSPISSPQEIGKIDGIGELTLSLEGGGATQTQGGSLSEPIKDNFNLVLTIARDRDRS